MKVNINIGNIGAKWLAKLFLLQLKYINLSNKSIFIQKIVISELKEENIQQKQIG